MKRLIQQIIKAIRQKKPRRQLVSPEQLPNEARQQALQQARFLFDQHGVTVRSLQDGEVPAEPKPAEHNP